jgi:Protein of unknown function (DUF3768)
MRFRGSTEPYFQRRTLSDLRHDAAAFSTRLWYNQRSRNILRILRRLMVGRRSCGGFSNGQYSAHSRFERCGGRVVLTQGVDGLNDNDKMVLLAKVRMFDDFNRDNDPHGQHDFGNFQLSGHRLFFKIDYYDASLEFGSEDPSDPSKTTRVLTIMLAEEY